MLLVPNQGDLAFILSGDIAYNFSAKGKTFPSLLAGYGIANSLLCSTFRSRQTISISE